MPRRTPAKVSLSFRPFSLALAALTVPLICRRRGIRRPLEERVAGGWNRVRPGSSHGRPEARRLLSRFPQSV